MIKKLFVFGIMLIALVLVAGSVQAKELWVGATVRGELVHGTQLIDFVSHPDARVSFAYSFDGSRRILHAPRTEKYDGRDKWIISGIPDSVSTGELIISYPGCQRYTSTIRGSGSFGRPGSTHGLVVNDFRQFDYYAKKN